MSSCRFWCSPRAKKLLTACSHLDTSASQQRDDETVETAIEKFLDFRSNGDLAETCQLMNMFAARLLSSTAATILVGEALLRNR